MSQGTSPLRYSGEPATRARSDASSLADLLERILDKGIVIAGDIAINLVDIELLTIKLRLLVASVDKAREMGVNWWESDPWLSGRAAGDNDGGNGNDRLGRLEAAVEQIQSSISALSPGTTGADGAPQEGGRVAGRRGGNGQ